MSDSTQVADQTRFDESARQVAAQHLLMMEPSGKPSGQPLLLLRLKALDSDLQRVYQAWVETSDQDSLLPSAADWLLDNYYIVRQVMLQLKEDLPPAYYRQLPLLDATNSPVGIQPHLPRVYALANALVEQVTLQTSLVAVVRFLEVYQATSPLTMGEIWAIPSMLRYVLLERMTQALLRLTQDDGQATTGSKTNPADGLPVATKEVIEKETEQEDASADARAQQDQADDDQVVADAFIGLRVVNSTDWLQFFEAVSLVHKILTQDPAAIYAEMTDETRNRYREQVEHLARHSRHSEIEVATRVVALAGQARDLTIAANFQANPESTTTSRTWHVGFYLLEKGRAQLEDGLAYAPPISWRLRQLAFDHPTPFYFGTIFLLTIFALAALLVGTTRAGGALWQILLVTLLGVVPALTFAVSIFHWLLTLLLPPRILPKLALSDGVPATARTMVVIPALLTRLDDVDELFQQLELHYLRNQDPNGHVTFALLTDFGDAPTATLSDDDQLLAHAKSTVRTLNERYPGRPFYFFHRPRLWNASEGVWMGWERKRGKLDEFNRLLRFAAPSDGATGREDQDAMGRSFLSTEGDLAILPQVRYVITLDADTILPRDAARRLVATITHPLNQAVFDPETGRVSAGYTVLQPRTEINATSATRSLFTEIFAGDAGIDLYTLAVSDVYQDLFGEGIYVGKGIYDVDAFTRSMEGRIPENTILSHDLFEGLHGRAGLVTDIVLFEEYPSHYLVNIRRSHRWVRGDWQLLPWLGKRVPFQGGDTENQLPLIARWKIVDNLRRSLLSPILLLWLVAGWTILPGAPWLWTLIGMLVPGIPIFTTALGMLARLGSKDNHRFSARPLWKSALRWLLQLAFLPYEALITAHAIGITLVRLTITRRHLLQWVTAAHNARLLGENISAETITQQITPSLIMLIPMIGLTLWLRPHASFVAFPLWVLWAFAAEIAYRIGRSGAPAPYAPSQEERQQLRTLARRTWLFYEQFVGPDDNWLPPDHFQESPKGIVAHHTSPTNVGLYLLSVLAAHDFGYIGTTNFSLRLRSAFDALGQLQHHQGHLFNWFDTRTLNTLNPAYVSTVDSGNLAAALVVLKQGCLSLLCEPLPRWEIWLGLLDALALLADEVGAGDTGEADAPPPNEPQPVEKRPLARSALLAQIAEWQRAIVAAEGKPESWPALLRWLKSAASAELEKTVLAYVDSTAEILDSERLSTLRAYIAMLHRQLANMQYEFDLLLPWQFLFVTPPHLFTNSDLPERLATAWAKVRSSLPHQPTLTDAATLYGNLRVEVEELQRELDADLGAEWVATCAEARIWCQQTIQAVQTAQPVAQSLFAELEALANEAEQRVAVMDFAFVFDAQRKLFHIGYNATTGKLDNNYYDLLASEARLASLVAIAKYDVPQSHWIYLGRPITFAQGHQVLLSWSGTMFEYLMPMLIARSYPGTLLHESCQTAVIHQQRYGQQHHVPWGVSESGYYQFDNAQNYQYRAFGVPGLGLKRGLEEELVIAPYASLLAVGLDPAAVLQNLTRMQNEGMQGRYGLYEAVDYTTQRLAVGQEKVIIRSYMAHHQGMILLALGNYLQGNRMVERFHRDLAIQSVDLLLQEQLPALSNVDNLVQAHKIAPQRTREELPRTYSWSVPVDSVLPIPHLLGNGRLATIITNSGSGFSRWNNTTLTRWRPDPTLDQWGVWIYLQELATSDCWSVGRQPLAASPATKNETNDETNYEEVTFYPHMVEFRHRRADLTVQMQVTVAAEADVEIRYLTLTNNGDDAKRLRLTSYGEVVLGDGASDLRHQAFAKLFIESEFLAEYNALLFRRRPRTATEHPPLMAHALVTLNGARTGAFESDRSRFLGRGRTTRNPLVLENSTWLSGSAGATLDPIMALGEEVEIAPHSAVELALLTLAAPTKAEIEKVLAHFQNWSAITRAFTSADSVAVTLLEGQDLGPDDVATFDQLLARLLYSHSSGRAAPAILAANRLGQPGLWRFGISGDHPILLIRLHYQEQSALLRKLIQAHRYWRRRGLLVDLVIANEEESNYGLEMQGAIWRSIQRMGAEPFLNQPGGIFMIRQDQMQPEEYTLLQSAARLVIDAEEGSLEEQMAARTQTPSVLPNLLTTLPPDANRANSRLARPQNLQFDNGLGGFSPDGSEYVIYLEAGTKTPAPWINVIANEEFGFLAGESGSGYNWAGNSGENRITAWRNDPVSDLPSEMLYIRDEETGRVWSPTPLPAPSGEPYLVRHGVGYTTYEHHAQGLEQRLRLFGTPDAPVKYIQVRLRNHLPHVRRLTVTYYAEWVLGVERSLTAPYILSEYGGDSRAALFATNPYNTEFGDRCAFIATDKLIHGFTTDRTEFLGRNGDYADPVALRRVGLSGAVQPGQDPCAVLQIHINLPPDAEEEFIFLLGQGDNAAHARDLVHSHCTSAAATVAWDATAASWAQILGTVQVKTPEPSMDLLLNQWLLYQTIACRLWGRSALYQSSGAYGFRDQLQDVMALFHARPDLARTQLLRAARHQFAAGDVLHWWHPPSGRGVRTRISDDLLWLPYVTALYVASTGDLSILEERVPFLHGEPLAHGEDERYAEYASNHNADHEYSFYEHCRRSLLKGTTQGRHGLPLMGGGDWNDGMNRVGIEGEGESIWLGWFLYTTQIAFADVADAQAKPDDALLLRSQAADLQKALEVNGWDGEWYRRAYYDDGTPLGSANNLECRIDSIAQSWAVLSGAANPLRAQQAMNAVRQNLVRQEDQLILLFTPPFNQTRRDPGYIKGYLPGVRENGGQYTHAALWSIWAWAKLGDGNLAHSLFQMINPIRRADSAAKAARYQVEPYVISADVYGVAPHIGRGGWSWYTGSSGWMYRLGIEGLLGLQRNATHLWLDPCIPAHWPGFSLRLRVGRTYYHFTVENPQGVQRGVITVTLDGLPVATERVPLNDDGALHEIVVMLGIPTAPA